MTIGARSLNLEDEVYIYLFTYRRELPQGITRANISRATQSRTAASSTPTTGAIESAP